MNHGVALVMFARQAREVEGAVESASGEPLWVSVLCF